eukprot:5676375-Amphidinium_carterae.1
MNRQRPQDSELGEHIIKIQIRGLKVPAMLGRTAGRKCGLGLAEGVAPMKHTSIVPQHDGARLKLIGDLGLRTMKHLAKCRERFKEGLQSPFLTWPNCLFVERLGYHGAAVTMVEAYAMARLLGAASKRVRCLFFDGRVPTFKIETA